MDVIEKIKKIDLNLTKNYIDLNNKFPENSKYFSDSIKNELSTKYYFNILKSINSYDKRIKYINYKFLIVKKNIEIVHVNFVVQLYVSKRNIHIKQ